MNVLFLTDPVPDYGADYLYDGFRCLGATVIDWPVKDALHWQREPECDCNLSWPSHSWTLLDVRAALAGRSFDLIVVPSLREGVVRACADLADLICASRDRVVFADGADERDDFRDVFRQAIGIAPAVYFKRELPRGAGWATFLPFGYPHYRRQDIGVRTPRAVYNSLVWPWAKWRLRGKLRRRFALTRTVHVPKKRTSVLENHAMNRRFRAAVVPAGQGYYTNRLWEVVADGCIPIVESPENMGIEASLPSGVPLFRTAGEAASAVKSVVNLEQSEAIALAEQCQHQWLEGHTTAARAQRVWSAIHGPARFSTRDQWLKPCAGTNQAESDLAP
jgi:hypothetical protein